MHVASGIWQTPERGREPAILRLPPAIRHRIYDHLDMRGSMPSQTRDGEDDASVFDLNDKCHLLPWPRRHIEFHGLLLSCRMLYDEASRLLYSTNHFTVRYSDRESLECIRNLRPDTVAVLRHLRIILCEASCHFLSSSNWAFGLQCCSEEMFWNTTQWCKDNHCHDRPLDGRGVSLNSREARLLSEWDSVAQHLAASVREDTLELALVCDVCPTDGGVTVAGSVMSSLLRLPTTKGCSVRFCQQRDPRLQQLAQDAVLWSRRIKPRSPSLMPPDQPVPNPASPLLSLPRELRLYILEHTDLITPWAQVTWSPDPKHRGFIASHWYCDNLEFRGQTCPPSRHHGCQFNRCFQSWPSVSRGCYCRLRHSAFSSTPPSVCNCWEPPQALFLTCRALREDAQAVFFSGNRFVVHDRSSELKLTHGIPEASSRSAAGAGGYPGPRLGASSFLRRVVPQGCLGHLRFLELVFPPYPPAVWPAGDHTALTDWDETVEWARTRLNVGGLTVRLVMADESQWEPREDSQHMTAEQGMEVISGYWRILRPLVRLRDLKRFYACFVSPWRRSEGVASPELARAKERELKKLAERLVLGERYELQCSGEEPEESLWNMKLIRDV